MRKQNCSSTPIIFYSASWKTALKAAIRWRDRLQCPPDTHTPTPEHISKHLFWATAFLCTSCWKVQKLTAAQQRRLNYMSADIYCAGRLASVLWQTAQNKERVFFAEPAPEKQQRGGGGRGGSVKGIHALSPPRSCLYQLCSIWSLDVEEEIRQNLLCWWEAVWDVEGGVLESWRR